MAADSIEFRLAVIELEKVVRNASEMHLSSLLLDSS